MRLSRRKFLSGTGVAASALSLNYAHPVQGGDDSYRVWEDLMRTKWTWDKVAHSSHGVNCAGHCAFKVFVKNGIVWREEQQGEYGATEDAPDYNPRGCQKGVRHSKYMYGKQRVLYPLKRVGERGEGQWQRISWDQACDEIADKYIDHWLSSGPASMSFAMGTAMLLKKATIAGYQRFLNLTGIPAPETFAGVGDQPIGIYQTLGLDITGDTVAAVYKAKCVLVWFCNPAVTRIPDAHFFWEARYNGTKVIVISPDFNPSAMHASKWVNPKPGSDGALAMAMAQVILKDKSYDTDYIKEQTDLPMLVRTDNGKFLHPKDLGKAGGNEIYYLWDEASNGIQQAPGKDRETIELGALQPSLEGTWNIDTNSGPLAVTTVFELLKKRAEEHTPEVTAAITGISPEVIREIARDFASAKPAMIYGGFRSAKWLYGDIFQRAMLLLLSLTGNLGNEGGGYQLTQLSKSDGIAPYLFSDIGYGMRIKAAAMWDYEHMDLKEVNRKFYGDELADTYDEHYQESLDKGWWPRQKEKPLKMAIFGGHNPGSWKAGGDHWAENIYEKVETIVSIIPDMGITHLYADYVLPVAHHYERHDLLVQPKTPYLQAMDKVVEPLGESVDDFTVFKRLSKVISKKAKERGIQPIMDTFVDGRPPIERDLTKLYDQLTWGGKFNDSKDIAEFLINASPGLPRITFDELAAKGIVRVEDSEGVVYGDNAPYATMKQYVEHKKHYETHTGRQQHYHDHDWYIKYDETLPGHKDPLELEGYPLRMLMGHARHSIHSSWRDDTFLWSLQRGEPDIYVNPNDAKDRGVADGDLIKIFNTMGSFIAVAHISSSMQQGMMFMYHGWDPTMFRNQKNFSSVITTAGLIRPTLLAGGADTHLGYAPIKSFPNMTLSDFTCDFELHTESNEQKTA